MTTPDERLFEEVEHLQGVVNRALNQIFGSGFNRTLGGYTVLPHHDFAIFEAMMPPLSRFCDVATDSLGFPNLLFGQRIVIDRGW